jgi:hypothetical protein
VYCKCFDVVSGRISMQRTALEVDEYIEEEVDIVQTAVQVSPIAYSMNKSFLRENFAKFVEMQVKARTEGGGFIRV